VETVEVPSQDLVERATAKAEEELAEAPAPKRKSAYDDPEIYNKSYKEEKRAAERKTQESDLKGRRCLFHGGVAVMKCQSCGSVLCKECTSSGACPRCKADLGTGPAKKKASAKAKEVPGEDEGPEPSEEEPQEEEKPEEEQAPEPQPRDWSRL
jgi:hypothetical protein